MNLKDVTVTIVFTIIIVFFIWGSIPSKSREYELVLPNDIEKTRDGVFMVARKQDGKIIVEYDNGSHFRDLQVQQEDDNVIFWSGNEYVFSIPVDSSLLWKQLKTLR